MKEFIENINVKNVWNFSRPFVMAGLILLIGHFLTVIIVKVLRKALDKAKLDVSLIKFLTKTTSIVLHAVIILSAINALGISTTGLLAALSAAAVAVALALKDSLSNIAGGILLLVAPRFATGDFIEENGECGTVVSVDLMHTVIRTPDNRNVVIPNGVLVNSQIINYSQETTRRIDIKFSIAYDNDVEVAKKAAVDTVMKHPLTLKDENAPFARVSSYGDSSVEILVRTWCNAADYWTVFFDLTEQVRVAFDQNGITIPFNQLDVHIKNDK